MAVIYNMDDILKIVDDLYDSIMEDGLEKYEKHLIDISLFLSDVIKHEGLSNRLYKSTLELLNLASVFEINNSYLNSLLLILKMKMIEFKLYNRKDKKESLNKIFCNEARSLFN